MNTTIADLDRLLITRRLWEGDHTLWRPATDEIIDRLGWLTVASEMRQHIGCLQNLGDAVKNAELDRIIILGMGGSSLGALALSNLFGSADGFPVLTVLDTTIPDQIMDITRNIDCSKTLFVVASKSGTTTEPNALYRYFRRLADSELGEELAGHQFVAICDAGTALERLAGEQGFRRIFTNPANIGGRFSVQSLFGLVPGSLIGVDVSTLLDRVESMSRECGPTVPAAENPGALLGAAIASHSIGGRDKITIVTTESLRGFGLWAEQLLAESTGKEETGVIPIVDEPELNPSALGDDRLFVYARLEGDRTDWTDDYIGRVEEAGTPTVRLNLNDKLDIGKEFFRWEFATAVIGYFLGINPFDQPNVQEAKDNTNRLLSIYGQSGASPSLEPSGSLDDLIARSKAGDYIAIVAYAKPASEFEDAISRLRRRITEISGVATTFGYGPRYLHSTGQLHKGGTKCGLFLQLTQLSDADVTIPREDFTFGTLAAAQAEGDFDALMRSGRPVARVILLSDAARSIDELIRSLD